MQPTKYATIEAEGKSIGRVRFSPTGDSLSYIVGGRMVATWDVKTKQQRKPVHKAEVVFLDMAYSPDGRLLAVSEVNALFHIDIRTGERTFLYRHGDENDKVPRDVRCVRYSQDGKRIVSGGGDHLIKVWDVEKKAEVAQVDCKGIVTDLALIPDTDQILATVSAANGTVGAYRVVLVDLKMRTVKPVIDDTTAMYESLAVSRDGKLFALAEWVRIRVKAIPTLKDDPLPDCPLDPVTYLFSESGRLLLTGGSTKGVHTLLGPPGEVAIFDRVSKKWVSHFRVLDREVTSMALSPKNDLLAVASTKLGAITVWDLSPVIESLPKDKTEKAPDGRRR